MGLTLTGITTAIPSVFQLTFLSYSQQVNVTVPTPQTKKIIHNESSTLTKFLSFISNRFLIVRRQKAVLNFALWFLREGFTGRKWPYQVDSRSYICHCYSHYTGDFRSTITVLNLFTDVNFTGGVTLTGLKKYKSEAWRRLTISLLTHFVCLEPFLIVSDFNTVTRLRRKKSTDRWYAVTIMVTIRQN